MTEMAYASNIPGVGDPDVIAAPMRIGNRSAGDRAFDGRLGHVVCDNRLWTAAERQFFCWGKIPIDRGDVRRFYFPMDRTTATAVDLGPQHVTATVSGATGYANFPYIWSY